MRGQKWWVERQENGEGGSSCKQDESTSKRVDGSKDDHQDQSKDNFEDQSKDDHRDRSNRGRTTIEIEAKIEMKVKTSIVPANIRKVTLLKQKRLW